MMVLAVAGILTGLLLPVLAQVRENVHQVISASNLRQIALGITMYARDHRDRLPYSALLAEKGEPLELMAANVGETPGDWDGFGLLYAGGYADTAEVFYCPSNRGQHSYERYLHDWRWPLYRRIYTNYHYCGHVTWDTQMRRRLEAGDGLVLAADGFRTAEDLNHENGFNVVRADGSVLWLEKMDDLAEGLPRNMSAETSIDIEEISELWNSIEKWSR